jgi:hypothetical protein
MELPDRQRSHCGKRGKKVTPVVPFTSPAIPAAVSASREDWVEDMDPGDMAVVALEPGSEME